MIHVQEKRQVVVFDCEADPIDRIQWGVDAERMQCTCACAVVANINLSSSSDVPFMEVDICTKFTCWRDVASDDGNSPFETLFLAFDKADIICGYNVIKFDFPLLKRYYGRSLVAQSRYMSHLSKTYDPFTYLFQVTGCYFKLNDILLWNGLSQKTASGREAIDMWDSGLRDELEKYCQMDVELTFEMALKFNLRLYFYGSKFMVPLPALVSLPVTKEKIVIDTYN